MHLKGKVRQNLFLVKLTNCRGRFHKPIYALRQAFTPNFYEGLLRRNNLAQCVRNWPSEKKHALCILRMVFMAGAGQYSGRTFVSPEKTAVQSPPQIFLFRPNNINLQCMFEEIFHLIGRVLSTSQPRLGKSCMRQIYYCMKRNVALEIGPMTSQQPGAASLRVMKLTAGNYQRWLKSYNLS